MNRPFSSVPQGSRPQYAVKERICISSFAMRLVEENYGQNYEKNNMMELRTLKYLGNDIAVDPNLEYCSLNDAEGVTAQ